MELTFFCSRKKSWLAVTIDERITLMNFHGSSTSPYIIFSLSWTLLVSFNFLHSSKMSRRCTKTLLPWPRYTFFHRFMPGILRYISRRRSSVISFRITAFISFKVTYMTFVVIYSSSWRPKNMKCWLLDMADIFLNDLQIVSKPLNLFMIHVINSHVY